MVPHKLSDEQMRGFIRDGNVLVTPDLPADFHEAIFRQTERVFDQEGNPGNNLIARIPDIKMVFDDVAVAGALTSVLGPNYYMHPHRHCHYNPPGSTGQQLHKDGFSRRRHRTRWIWRRNSKSNAWSIEQYAGLQTPIVTERVPRAYV